MTRWGGVVELLQDAVHHGTLGVERVHQRVARTPLDLVALVPPLAGAARCVAGCQAAVVGATYAAIRIVNGVVGTAAGAALDVTLGEAPRDPVAPPANPR
jgi:hypothetical protein